MTENQYGEEDDDTQDEEEADADIGLTKESARYGPVFLLGMAREVRFYDIFL